MTQRQIQYNITYILYGLLRELQLCMLKGKSILIVGTLHGFKFDCIEAILSGSTSLL